MTLDKIKEMVEERYIILDEEFVSDEDYYILKEFFSKYPNITEDMFHRASLWDIIKFVTYFKVNIWSSNEETCEKIDGFKTFVDELFKKDTDLFVKTMSTIGQINHDGHTDFAIDYLNSQLSNDDELINNHPLKSDDLMTSLITLKSKLKSSFIDPSTFIEFYFSKPKNDGGVILFNLMLAYYYVNDYSNVIKKITGEEDIDRASELIKKSHYKKTFADCRNHFKVTHVIGYINELKQRYNAYIYKEEEYYKNNEKEKILLADAISLLESSLENDEILNARDIARKIRNPEIKNAVLQFIYEHNNTYYDKLNQELEELQKSNKVKYQFLLKEYGYTIEEISIDSLMNYSVEDLDYMLKKLIKVFGFSKEDALIMIKFTDRESVEMIYDLYSKGIISSELIKDNISILDKTSCIYRNLLSNIATINSYDFNPSNFCNSTNVLIDSTGILKCNLDILIKYDLFKYLKTTNNYNFLLSSSMVSKIDTLLELGYEEFLKLDLGLLNYNTLNRLYVLKEIGESIESLEKLYCVLTDSFYIKDSEIDSCIYNAISYKEEVDLSSAQESLNLFRVSKRTYYFGDVLVSSNKVDRLLENGTSLYEAIFSGMKLTDGEYDRVISALKDKVYSKNS